MADLGPHCAKQTAKFAPWQAFEPPAAALTEWRLAAITARKRPFRFPPEIRRAD
jgi:hypothetical protein